jgi:hypothetical protein
MKRTLVLKRETLTLLTDGELVSFGGGNGGPTGPQPTPPQYVVTYKCTATNVVCLTYNATCTG